MKQKLEMKTRSQLKTLTAKSIAPLKKMSVSDWADTYRIISQGSAEPGKWRTSRIPYAKDIMDAFTQADVHRVVVKSSSQIGKSELLLCVVGRFAHLDPCNIMIIQPTVELAQDFSKSRVAPMIRDSKVLSKIFAPEKSRSSAQTILSKFFIGGRLVLVGSNAPSNLAGRPIRILLCDEVDRFPASSGGEGDPIDLAAKRQTTYWNYKTGIFSTPTTEGSSRIDVEFLAGTQEVWAHKCPNCGEFHPLDYRDMNVDATEQKDEAGNRTVIVRKVLWRCPDCGFEFSERVMKSSAQKYLVNNPDALNNGVRSFYVNGFSSPWLSWKNILREWLEARGMPTREAVVYNTRFGQSYKLAGEYDNENVFLDRRENYGAELPDGVLLLTAAVDVQANRLEYEIAGWGVDETRYGIIRGIIRGQPTEIETWQNLDGVLDRAYRFRDGLTLKVARTFIDSGYSTRAVYEYCAKNLSRQRFPIKGKGGAGLPLIFQYSHPKNAGVLLTILGVDDGKQEVFARLGISEVGAQYMHFPVDDEFFGKRGYDSQYFKQLISERRVAKTVGGVVTQAWVPVASHIRNEALDLAVYNLACLKSCIGKTSPIDFWNRRRELLQPVQVTTSAQVKKSPRVTTRNLDIY